MARRPSAFGRFLRFLIAGIVYGIVRFADRPARGGTDSGTQPAQVQHDIKKAVRRWGRAKTARAWCALMTPGFRRTFYGSDSYSTCRRDRTRRPLRQYRFTTVKVDGERGAIARAQNVRTRNRSSFHLVSTQTGWRLDAVTGPW